jgi:peptidoglycan-N-acetylglucosamine deacetylase
MWPGGVTKASGDAGTTGVVVIYLSTPPGADRPTRGVAMHRPSFRGRTIALACVMIGAAVLAQAPASGTAAADRQPADVVAQDGSARLASAVRQPASGTLPAGQTLQAGQELPSPSGRYRLSMQTDGNLVVYSADRRPVWATMTFVANSQLALQTDGNLVVRGPAGEVVWHTHTYGQSVVRADVQDDGNLVLYRTDGASWYSGWDEGRFLDPDRGDIGRPGIQMTAGQSLQSADHHYWLTLQTDGNVVVYAAGGRALWNSETWWAPGRPDPVVRLIMQADGNLVGYSYTGFPVWHSGTYANPGAIAVMQNDGNLVIYRANGSPAWFTGWDTMLASCAGVDREKLVTSRNEVALTFDLGGNAAGLASILQTLSDQNVTATFFVTGNWIRHFPDQLLQILGRGHPVGNHSDTHPNFTSLTDAQIRAELAAADSEFIRLTGRTSKPLFRFPSGDRDARTIGVVNGAGYCAWRWTVDTLGWKGTSGGITVQTVIDRALAQAQPGEIVLMHGGAHPDDGSTLDADALPEVIRQLRALGYTFTLLPR